MRAYEYNRPKSILLRAAIALVGRYGRFPPAPGLQGGLARDATRFFGLRTRSEPTRRRVFETNPNRVRVCFEYVPNTKQKAQVTVNVSSPRRRRWNAGINHFFVSRRTFDRRVLPVRSTVNFY